MFPHSFIDGPATSGVPHTSSCKAIVLFSVLRKTVSCLSEKVPVFPGQVFIVLLALNSVLMNHQYSVLNGNKPFKVMYAMIDW